MKNKILFILIVFFRTDFVQAQDPPMKFDLGGTRAAKGYVAVTPETLYSDQLGYGWMPWSATKAVDRGGSALKGDYITSDKPFYFSVKLPEGNYDVKLLLGDTKGTSATTVRAECRRLMLENIRTHNGEVTAQSFTVHVKDSMIRDANGKERNRVRLKSRESGYLHWDNLLTLEFCDTAAKVCAIEITTNAKASTIFLAGNSTVVDQSREPWAAWGQIFPRYLVPGKVAVANYAESGETMKAFKAERRLEKIFSLAKPGDYLFIEFTHNDQKPGGNHLDPFTTYQETIREWIKEARNRMMLPVLVTSMHRRRFDSAGNIENTLSDYPEAMRQLARAENVYLIDLNAMSKTLYEAWGPEQSIKAFVHYPANSFPGQSSKLEDNTHFTPYGATALARCIIYSIRMQQLPLAAFIRKGLPHYEPGKPEPVEKFHWPQSYFITGMKPEGN